VLYPILLANNGGSILRSEAQLFTAHHTLYFRPKSSARCFARYSRRGKRPSPSPR
jgi:hypothetical protein